MTLDPLAVVGAIAAMGTLLLFIVRAFATGAIMPRSTVPREDYEALQAVHVSVVGGFAALIDTVKVMADRVGKLVEIIKGLTAEVAGLKAEIARLRANGAK